MIKIILFGVSFEKPLAKGFGAAWRGKRQRQGPAPLRAHKKRAAASRREAAAPLSGIYGFVGEATAPEPGRFADRRGKG